MKLILREELGVLKKYIYEGGNIKDDYIIKRVPSDELENDDLLSPTSDKVFKIMFQREDNKMFACFLLSKFFKVEWEYLYKHLKLYNNELRMENVRDVNMRADFVGLIEDVFFTIEMNNTNEYERNEAYANKLSIAFVTTSKRSEYKWVVQLNIDNFKVRGLNEGIVISESTDGRYARTKKLFIDVYLPNIRKKYEMRGIESLSEQERCILCMFVSKRSIAEELAKGERILMDFIKKLQELNGDDGLLRAYDHELAEKEEARREGKIEGEKTGREKTAIEMIKANLPEDIIAKCTKFTIEQVRSMKSAIEI